MKIRKKEQRGLTKIDWLKSYHSFPFNYYRDPEYPNFGSLLVLNDDLVEPSQGFGTHPHANMEIVSYVLSGKLTHRDSTGSQGIIEASQVQRMSAGTGVFHSEMNPLSDQQVHFLQVWILPNEKGLTPEYEQKNFSLQDRNNQWLTIASGQKDGSGVYVHQDIVLEVAHLTEGENLTKKLEENRQYYLYLIDGKAQINGQAITTGDAAIFTEVQAKDSLMIEAQIPIEVILFDVAKEG